MPTIRPECAADVAAIHAVNCATFPTGAEARLVDRLRASGHAKVSLVAEADGVLVGHILFSPVRIVTPARDWHGLGLAPMAVMPSHQNRGIGSELVRRGVDVCRRDGWAFVVVLGHPTYYPRFGFRRASAAGLSNEYGADDAFMFLELQASAVPSGGGLVKYGPEFAEWS